MSRTHSGLIMDFPAHLVLKLDTHQPIELSAFVGAFTSIANEYARFIEERLPDSSREAEIYVKEVRVGCIEADLIPMLAPLISSADNVIVLEDFVRRWGKRFQALIRGDRSEGPYAASELKDWADAVRAIASDPDASAVLSAATYEDGKRQIKAAFKFDSSDARQAETAIAQARQTLLAKGHEPHSRVLMSFTRTDIGSVNVGKRSGERVKIEAISRDSLPLMYGAELAEAQIKHEIREADENVYKKGFVVDVLVGMKNEKPAYYSVTNLHSVIELD